MAFEDREVAEYRSVSGAAVVALILGILSPAAFVDPVVWGIPIAGALTGAFALFRIRRNPTTLVGRKAALVGLWLSVCFAIAAPTERFYYRYCIRAEAKQYAALWFELLADGRPERAFQLTVDPKNRQPLDDRLDEHYRKDPKQRKMLAQMVAPAPKGEKPSAVRTLLALGKSAETRYVDTVSQISEEGMEILQLRYAVTYADESGQKKTFLLLVALVRRAVGDAPATWTIRGCDDGVEKKAE
jgi:hypothetical protein